MPSSPGEGQEERQQAISGEEWEDASPAQKIKWLLGPEGSKWGWVVYRTCYKPELDAPWEMLQRIIVANCKDEVGDDPEVLDKMDWRFVSDPTTLDGADRDQLREKFKTFVEGEDPGVVVVAKDGGLGTKGSRYEVFLEADEQALLSCLGMDSGKGGDYGAYVNVVRGWVDSRMMPPEDASAEEREEWDLDDWMRISVGMVGPASWVEMDNPENWYIYWAKPECGRVWAS
ncbi:Putative protein of unknown function [Podospora comata]|uniref:Uncharacterized protein n=1 Tax=Podospora comata TaxID=48703 RepID=A0ABY6RZ38_PODCO|nr:Putative protein of unknown function [Podospora comata]